MRGKLFVSVLIALGVLTATASFVSPSRSSASCHPICCRSQQTLSGSCVADASGYHFQARYFLAIQPITGRNRPMPLKNSLARNFPEH